jgi:hypothetical protein
MQLQTSKMTVFRELFVISMISLFLEMLVIRWLATEVRVFAYFKNLPLMAAFLGLGLGLLWTDKKQDFFKWSSLALLYFSGLMIVAVGWHLTHLTLVDPYKVMFFGGFQIGTLPVAELARNIAIVIGIFALSGSIFVGLGQRTGRLFENLRPLQAYSINIAGALAGICLFAWLSNLQTDPGIWLVVAGLLFLLIDRRVTNIALIALGIAYTLFLGPYMARMIYGSDYVTTVWSPYYRIDVQQSRLPAEYNNVSTGYGIYINYDGFQSMVDCTPACLSKVPPQVKYNLLETYEKPFHLLKRPAENVLILGAGSGSDVAAALRCGAKHIDAVEIDRAIYQLGKRLNPEKPYDSPKVTVHIMDARTFLKTSRSKYDVIVFAMLDSHTAFSSMSSLRTDNYIFTVESLKEAKKLLSNNGLLTVFFACVPDFLWDRHCKDLDLAFGKPPVGFFWMINIANAFLVDGVGSLDHLSERIAHPSRPVVVDSAIPEATDDWPFLFLPKRAIPLPYTLPILAVLLASILTVGRPIVAGCSSILNWQMFCLGMGFMLLEVRAMSALSLLCGATWTVNSLVIAGVMVMVLIANLIASRLSASRTPVLLVVAIVAIVVSNLVSVADLNNLQPALAQVLGVVIFLCPLMVASSVFSLLFKQTETASRALAFNIIGGLAGVSIEYVSMIWSIKALAWIAVAIYGMVLMLGSWSAIVARRPNS